MATLLTDKFKLTNAIKVLDLFSSATDSVYCFLAKVTEWNTGTEVVVAPDNSLNDDIATWDDMFYANKVGSNDASLVIPCVEWQTGVTYDPYEDDSDMSGKTWYAIDPTNRRVYKCITNNSNTPSITKPVSTSDSGIIHHSNSDGYKWKYMFTSSAADVSKFYTSDVGFKWFPIKKLVLDNGSSNWDIRANAVHGSIEYIKSSKEIPYSDLTIGDAITLVGDGTGFAGVVATYSGLGSGYNNKYINITDSGIGYTKVSKVLVENVQLNPDTLTAIISPIGGHGFDPSKELNASAIMVASEFTSGMVNIGPNQEYRKSGLILNPIVSWGDYDDITSIGTSVSSGTRYNGSVVHQMIKLVYPQGTDIGGFTEDTSLFQGTDIDTATGVGYIVFSDTGNNTFYINITQGTFVVPTSVSNVIGNTANSNSLDSTEVSSITNYDGTSSTVLTTLKRYSGDLIYVDHFLPITREAAKETIRIVIQF